MKAARVAQYLIERTAVPTPAPAPAPATTSTSTSISFGRDEGEVEVEAEVRSYVTCSDHTAESVERGYVGHLDVFDRPQFYGLANRDDARMFERLFHDATTALGIPNTAPNVTSAGAGAGAGAGASASASAGASAGAGAVLPRNISSSGSGSGSGSGSSRSRDTSSGTSGQDEVVQQHMHLAHTLHR